jgi:hypothetical protein
MLSFEQKARNIEQNWQGDNFDEEEHTLDHQRSSTGGYKARKSHPLTAFIGFKSLRFK